MKKVFVVSYIYQEYGGRATQHIVGAFATKEEAEASLEKVKNKTLKSLDIAEPDMDYCIVEKDKFLLTDSNDSFMCDGTITECKVGVTNLEDL